MFKTLEERKAFVQRFNVFDDAFFEMVAKDKTAVEDILRVILHDRELVITKLTTQESIKNLFGKSVRLDALCITENGNAINVEIQNSNNDNHAKRVRYNASCITADVSEPGEKYENLNDVYIIYISRFDVFNRKRRLYYVEHSFRDRGDVISVNDGEHFIFVNASNNVDADAEDADVAELMAFFKNSNGQNEKFHRLTNRVYDVKNKESEVNAMCDTMMKFAIEHADEIAKEFANDYVKEFAEKYAQDYAEKCVEKNTEKIICELIHKGALSVEAGAEQLNMSVAELSEIVKKFEQNISESV